MTDEEIKRKLIERLTELESQGYAECLNYRLMKLALKRDYGIDWPQKGAEDRG